MSSFLVFYQDLIEKVMVLRKAVESMVGLGIGQAAAEKLANYASILASQGKLEAAMGYLPDSVDKVMHYHDIVDMHT